MQTALQQEGNYSILNILVLDEGTSETSIVMGVTVI